jgi:hypothetical protein
MEQLKALEILEAISENEEKVVFDDGSFYKNEFIYEAIAELEALQKPNTCDGCKWNDLGDTEYKPIYYPCRSCLANKHFSYNYEPKL